MMHYVKICAMNKLFFIILFSFLPILCLGLRSFTKPLLHDIVIYIILILQRASEKASCSVRCMKMELRYITHYVKPAIDSLNRISDKNSSLYWFFLDIYNHLAVNHFLMQGKKLEDISGNENELYSCINKDMRF